VLRRPREVSAQPPGGLSPVDVRASSPCLKSRGRRVARLVSGHEPTRGTSARWAGWRLGRAAARRARRTSECPPRVSAWGANHWSVSRPANRNANEFRLPRWVRSRGPLTGARATRPWEHFETRPPRAGSRRAPVSPHRPRRPAPSAGVSRNRHDPSVSSCTLQKLTDVRGAVFPRDLQGRRFSRSADPDR
jgi:hypothetical protein